jgi:ubiquinone/menaquinone biosynthesis C-methylase UbiE
LFKGFQYLGQQKRTAILNEQSTTMEPSDNHWHNRAAWDQLAKKQDRLAKPARDTDFNNPLKSVDGPGWLGGDITGKRVLCLAAGGGRQGPIYASAGAIVTVVDISPAMLELDRVVALERNLKLTTVEASMDDLSVLGDRSFDIVIHPVSTCYVPDVVSVYAEVARVLMPGGIYISQHKQPTSLQTALDSKNGSFHIQHSYYRTQPLPPSPRPNLVREEGTLEYVHRLENLLGAMCRAGLFIEDLTEPLHAKPDAELDSFAHRCQFVAPYIRIKARRAGTKSAKLIVG